MPLRVSQTLLVQGRLRTTNPSPPCPTASRRSPASSSEPVPWTSSRAPNDAALCSLSWSQPSHLTRRRYATLGYDESGLNEEGRKRKNQQHAAPPPPKWPTARHPTPYQVFDQHRSAPYSKARFYALVKLYHPDRHHHYAAEDLAPAARLERYRLVVAANDILSDPTKRRAYDLLGAGWAGPHMNPGSISRESEKAWRADPNSPAMNATWEDWERWYDKQNGGSGERQSPLYVSNGGFVGIIALFAVIGSWAQATRMENQSHKFIDMVDHRHDVISQEMRRRTDASQDLNKEERIENFLMQREGWGYEDPPIRGHGAHETKNSRRA